MGNPAPTDAEGGSRPIYSIGAVARILDLPPATLRTWEDRYGLVAPERSEAGRRLYSRDQLDQLRYVKERVDEGIQPADAHRLLAERIGDRPDPAAPEARRDMSRALILLADRDLFAADLAEHFLRFAGYEVDLAYDAADAERRFVERRPQLAIVELLLSDGAGIDLCRRLKEDHGALVLAVSSLSARDQALAAGADAFLAKPLDPRELVSAVQDLLGATTAGTDAEEGESG